MKILDAKQFFLDATSAGESEVFLTNGAQMTVEVYGEASTFSVTIMGQAALKPIDEWTELATIRANDFDVNTKLTAKGIYFVALDGIGRVKAVIENTDGKISVSGKIGE